MTNLSADYVLVPPSAKGDHQKFDEFESSSTPGVCTRPTIHAIFREIPRMGNLPMPQEAWERSSAGTEDLIPCSMVLPAVSHRSNGAANKTVDDPTDPGLGGAASAAYASLADVAIRARSWFEG